MKLRKSRQVKQGLTNYNDFIKSKTILKQSQTKSSNFNNNKNCLTLMTKIIHSDKQLTNQQNSYKAKIFERLSNPKQKFQRQTHSKVQQILSTLKNCCEYKKYQYFNIFNYFNKKKNGKVNQEQFIKLMKNFGYQINQQEANQIVMYFNNHQENNNQETNINLKNQIKSNTIPLMQSVKQNYFTLRDFVQGIGNYSERDRKITGDPLQLKLSKQKQQKKRYYSQKRNSSINIKNLLVDVNGAINQNQDNQFGNTQSNTQNTQGILKKTRPQTAMQRGYRLSCFKRKDTTIEEQNNSKIFMSNQQKYINKSIVNHLIPRSNLNSEQKIFLISKKSNNFLSTNNIKANIYSSSSQNQIKNCLNKFTVDKDIKALISKDQYNLKLFKINKYQRKLSIIKANNDNIQAKCQIQNFQNQQKQKFSESWGMLSKNNNWVRS